MISKAVWKKAQNLEVVRIWENTQRIEFIVGYPVTFHKKAGKFTCGCKGHVCYDIGACGYKYAAATKGEHVPVEIKEAVLEEEIR
jgi:hypothetical protein